MDKLINFETAHDLAIAHIKELTEHGTIDSQEFNHLANWLRFTDVPEEEYLLEGRQGSLDNSLYFRSLLTTLQLRMLAPSKMYCFAVFNERPRICFVAERYLDESTLSKYLCPHEQDSWEVHCNLGPITFLPDAYAFTKAVEDRYLKSSKEEFVKYAGVYSTEVACAHFRQRPVFSESWVTELAEEIAESAEFYARQKTARIAV